MFYKCYYCKTDIETNFEETHYHLRMVKSSCGVEEVYYEIVLCKECFDLKLREAKWLTKERN